MVNRTAIIKQPDNISFFNDVYKLQKEYQEALILDNSNPDFIWIGEHQLCYTLGRGSNYDNLLFSACVPKEFWCSLWEEAEGEYFLH